jgi:hypothetical protein
MPQGHINKMLLGFGCGFALSGFQSPVKAHVPFEQRLLFGCQL